MNGFQTEILRRAGGDPDEVLRIAHAALCLLAPCLSEHGRRAASLRGADASALRHDTDGASGLADLIARTAARAGAPLGQAAEVAGVVAAVLGAGQDRQGFLADDCAAELIDLFFGHPEASALPPAPPHPPEPPVVDERRTLSTGKPGAARPLVSAHSTAQHGSVVDPLPHGGSKLSSGAPSLERGAKTLATGAPKGEPLP